MANDAITIDSPSELKYKTIVYGRVFEAPTEVIQCLIRADDGFWYTQRAALRTDEQKWVCVVVLGYPEFKHSDYVLAAGVGGKRILAPRVAELPSDVLWVTQDVSRSQ